MTSLGPTGLEQLVALLVAGLGDLDGGGANLTQLGVRTIGEGVEDVRRDGTAEVGRHGDDSEEDVMRKKLIRVVT